MERRRASPEAGEAVLVARGGLTVKVTSTWRGDPGRTAKLDAALAMVATEGVALVKGNIQRQGLIDTGFMLNSVHKAKVGDLLYAIAVGAEYAIYHEFGTSRMPAHPIVNPAIMQLRPLFERQVKAALR